MSLLWAIPVAAAAGAMVIVVVLGGALESAARGLTEEVAALHELREPLAGLRRATLETDAQVMAFRAAHAPVGAEGDGAEP
jgi:hypothetical protein